MAKSTTASSTLSKSTTSCDEDMHRDLAKPQASAPEVADEVETSSSPSQGQESNLTNSVVATSVSNSIAEMTNMNDPDVQAISDTSTADPNADLKAEIEALELQAKIRKLKQQAARDEAEAEHRALFDKRRREAELEKASRSRMIEDKSKSFAMPRPAPKPPTSEQADTEEGNMATPQPSPTSALYSLSIDELHERLGYISDKLLYIRHERHLNNFDKSNNKKLLEEAEEEHSNAVKARDLKEENLTNEVHRVQGHGLLCYREDGARLGMAQGEDLEGHGRPRTSDRGPEDEGLSRDAHLHRGRRRGAPQCPDAG